MFATPQLRSLLGDNVAFIDTGAPVARQTRRLLAAAGRLNPTGQGTVTLLSTGQRHALVQAAQRWLDLPTMAQQRDVVVI